MKIYPLPDPFVLAPSGETGLLIRCRACSICLYEALAVPLDSLLSSLGDFPKGHTCQASLSLWLTGQGGALVLARDRDQAVELLRELSLPSEGLEPIPSGLLLFLEYPSGIERPAPGYQLSAGGSWLVEIPALQLQAWLPRSPFVYAEGVYHA